MALRSTEGAPLTFSRDHVMLSGFELAWFYSVQCWPKESVHLAQAQGNRERSIELGELTRTQMSPEASQHALGQRKKIIAVRCRFMIKSLILTQRDLSDMAMK